MSYRHVDEIDRAVHVARKALSLTHLRRPERLARFLYHRWYLGQPSHQNDVPAQRSHMWQAWSKQWTEQHAKAGNDLVRLHLTCAPHTSLHAIGMVTDRAKQWDFPWRLTSTAATAALPAPDATVLYLPVENLAALRPALEELVHDLQPFLASAVPALTLRIGRGASLAQNPADGRSFGEHRCGLVARSVIESQQLHHKEQVVRTMRTFAAAGIDPKRPYLEAAGSWDQPWVFA
jgi:hypothetical protein